jgi:adenosylcobinamide-phosphate synthase
MGRAITRGEALGRSKAAGVLLALGLPLLSAGLAWALLRQAGRVHPWLSWGLNCVLIYFCVACRDMLNHARSVLLALKSGDLALARDKVAMIVGRDTQNLDEDGVLRACVESVAESASDGLVAPLFYAYLGGAPLALAYKAVSTLDSMIGYKNERYADFGWASARLDDLLNWLPARLSALLVALLAPLLGGSVGQTLQAVWQDASKQPSPNSGWPEAAFAGALGVRLGGPSVYGGVTSVKAWLGSPRQALSVPIASAACRLFFLLALAAVILGEGITHVLG